MPGQEGQPDPTRLRQPTFPPAAAPLPETALPLPGRTVISEAAVAKVAAVAARSVPGVHMLGAGTRPLGAIRDAVGGTDVSQGVRAEVGESEIAVDVILVASYGVALQELANAVRAAVYAAVESLVGLRVIEVNVEINDVHVAGLEPEKAPARPRFADRLSVPARGAPTVGTSGSSAVRPVEGGRR
jgi:uncharacterized alkaline shock family protein YloU